MDKILPAYCAQLELNTASLGNFRRVTAISAEITGGIEGGSPQRNLCRCRRHASRSRSNPAGTTRLSERIGIPCSPPGCDE